MTRSLLLLSSGLLFSQIQLSAQPTLTSSGINPNVGESVNHVNGGWLSPGNAGASQTWDFSAMTTGTPAPTTFIAPSSTPHFSTFSTANVAISSGGSYAYYTTSANAWQNAGVVSSNGVVMSYTDKEDLLRFPCSFNNNYSDTWSTTFVNGGYTYYRTGITTVTADGWGTLITPDGTFTNVMRVHFYQDYQDSVNLSGTPFVFTYENDEYMWYLNGNHNPIAFVYELSTNGGPAAQAGFYMSGVMGVNGHNALVSYDVFPNPATDYLTIDISLKKNSDVRIHVLNTLGAEVCEVISAEAHQGDNSYCIGVQHLPAGIYCAEVALDGVPVSTRRIVINK